MIQDELGQLIASRRKALGIPEPTEASASFSDVQGGSSSSADGDDLGRLIAERRKVLGIPEPGVVSRAVSKIGDFASNLVHHPINTIGSTVIAPIESAFTAAVAPGVGEARPDPRLSKGGNASGRAIDTSAYDAQHGGVTQRERANAGMQALATIAAPGASSIVGRAAAPVVGKVLGKGAGLATAGALEGAAFNPDDPAAGALAGGLMTTAVGGATAGAVRGTEKVAQATSLPRRVMKATPIDENVVAQNRVKNAADAANYGLAEEQGAANGGTSAALQAALENETVKPYVEILRDSPRFRNASDAELAREVHTLMSHDRLAQEALVHDRNGLYNPKAHVKAGDLADALKTLRAATAEPGVDITEVPAPTTAQSPAPPLRDVINLFHEQKGIAARRTEGTIEQQAARRALERHDAENVVSPPLTGAPTPATFETPTPGVMEAFPTAVSEHARMMGERGAFNAGVNDATRFMGNGKIKPEKLDTQGKAAVLQEVAELPVNEAIKRREGLLGGARNEVKSMLPGGWPGVLGAVSGGVGGHPLMGAAAAVGAQMAGTAARNADRINRIEPLARALDARIGDQVFTPADLSKALEIVALSGGLTTAPVETEEERRRKAAMLQVVTGRR